MFGYRNYILLRAMLAVVLIKLRTYLLKLVFKGDAAPHPGDTTVSHKWVERVIRRNGFPAVVVDSIKIGSNENNRGLVGSITKIEVVYAPEHRNNAELPTRLVLKMSKHGFSGISSVLAFRSYREAWFYNTQSPISPSSSASSQSGSESASSTALKSVYPNGLSKAFGENAPFVWYAYGSGLFGELVLLQEDVSFNHECTPLNFVFGNQIWGLPAPVEPPRDQVEALKNVYTVTAKHHAAFWKNPELIQRDWMKAALWYQGKERQHWEYAVESTRKHWESAKAKAANPDSGFKIDPKLRSIIDKTLEKTNWNDFQEHIHSNPFTLCHGDYHASNMFIYRKPGSTTDIPVWFDWSEIGPYEPTTDLAQMLISDVKPEVFTAHSKELVRTYYDALIKNGVSEKEYSWQTCWNAFCRGGCERWIWVLCLLTDFPLPGSAMQYFHDQLLAFINHHCPTEDHFKLKILAAAL